MGKGSPVVMIHGAFSHEAFGTVPKELAKTNKVYLLHLPGFGASDHIPNKRHTTDLFAAVLDAFIVNLGLQKAPIVGMSLGSIVTLKAASRGNIKGKLILVGMPVNIVGAIPKIVRLIPYKLMRFIGSTDFGKKGLLVPAMQENLGIGSKEEVEELLSHTAIQAVTDIDYYKEINKDLPKILNKVKNRVIFIYGEKDTTYLLATNLQSNFQQNCLLISGAGHSLFFSHPKELLKEIKLLI